MPESSDRRQRIVFVTLLLLFVVGISVYLHRVPGLLGDEGSEGENVWQIINTKQLTVVGERSYIGPLIDYLRIPFVLALGYNALALRLVMGLASILLFFVTGRLAQRYLGGEAALYVLAFIFFSPAYLLYQRLGWAITLIPLFIVLMLWATARGGAYGALFVGILGGLGVSNHFIFLPSFVAVTAILLLLSLFKVGRSRRIGSGVAGTNGVRPVLRRWLPPLLLFLIGFWAAFGTQFTVLVLQPEDQGVPEETLTAFTDRVQPLTEVLPKLVSGSAYSALYTGTPYPAVLAGVLLFTIGIGLVSALLLRPARTLATMWLAASVLQLFVLILIIDRHAVRYYIPAALSVWGLAGLGWYKLTHYLPTPARIITPVLISVILMGISGAVTLLPYLRSGGSTVPVALHEGRSEAAAAHVDIRPLLSCLQNAGTVTSENVHIYNRLLYLSHGDAQLQVVEAPADAVWLVHYRSLTEAPGERCPELLHFRVVPASEENPA